MFVIENYDDYNDQPAIGDNQCVKLVQDAMGKVLYGPNRVDEFHTRKWRAGQKITSDRCIRSGTMIATFNSEGRYESLPTGNHAAIYIRHVAGGIEVMDQFIGKPRIAPRIIRFKTADDIKREGDRYKRSNDANQYSIIEMH